MPCRVFVAGKELPGNRVVLQVSLSSNLSSELTVQSLDLSPQPGFSYNADQSHLAQALPLEVPESRSLTLILSWQFLLSWEWSTNYGLCSPIQDSKKNSQFPMQRFLRYMNQMCMRTTKLDIVDRSKGIAMQIVRLAMTDFEQCWACLMLNLHLVQIPADGSASLLLFLSVVDTASEESLGRRSSRLQSCLSFRLQADLERPPSTAYQESTIRWFNLILIMIVCWSRKICLFQVVTRTQASICDCSMGWMTL